jgi:hypothetical protein
MAKKRGMKKASSRELCSQALETRRNAKRLAREASAFFDKCLELRLKLTRPNDTIIFCSKKIQ